MATITRLRPVSQNSERLAAILATRVAQALSSMAGRLEVTAGISAEEAEVAALNGAIQYYCERMIARPDGVRQVHALRDELVPFVVCGKKQVGAL